jgi:hypothetical protein
MAYILGETTIVNIISLMLAQPILRPVGCTVEKGVTQECLALHHGRLRMREDRAC